MKDESIMGMIGRSIIAAVVAAIVTICFKSF